MRVLLTGFEPFRGYIENSSWAVVKHVVNQNIEGVELCVKQLPVSFKSSAEELRIAVKNFSPDVIVMLGQSAASDKVRLERIAINMMDAKNPDNDGVLPDEEPISPNGRTALFTQLPIKKLCASIAAQGVPVVVSNSCGLYVCNRLYYEALNLCEHAPQMKAIFVHVPLYKGQVDTQDGMGMNLHDMSTAIEVVIKSVLQ